MKSPIALAVVALTGCAVFAFAAEKEKKAPAGPCDDAYNKAVGTCENEKASCKARQTDPVQCQQRYDLCVRNAENARTECQNKSGGAKAPTPAGTPKKK